MGYLGSIRGDYARSKMAATRGVHALLRGAGGRFVRLKSHGNLLKCSGSMTQVLSQTTYSTTTTACSLSPKTRQMLNSLAKNNKWNKSVLDSIKRSSAPAIVCLLSTSSTSQLASSLLCGLDELSTDGDEDSTNRKKRIYSVGFLNDDP